MWIHCYSDGGAMADGSLAYTSYLPCTNLHAAHVRRVHGQGGQQQLRHGKDKGHDHGKVLTNKPS